MDLIKRFSKTSLWGISVALAWTWGIGLFFAVQSAIQFGITGLIAFASINAFGLTMFGVINGFIAKKYQSPQAYEAGFLARAANFKFAFLIYQFLALTLTLFAILKYVTLPLGVLSILVCVVFIGATIFLGEEFDIRRIKYSHFIMFLGVVLSLSVLLKVFGQAQALGDGVLDRVLIHFNNPNSLYYFWIPIAVGFLLGPWLDLQHWQRAIQIRKEGLSITKSYIVGGLVFWGIIVADGLIAVSVFNLGHPNYSQKMGLFTQVKDSITQYFSMTNQYEMLGFYIAFVCLAALATFDSGYVALKWYLRSLVKGSQSLIFSLVPESFIVSPIPWFFAVIVGAITTLHFSEVGKFISSFDPSLQKFFRFELEYYMAFYASFFVMFAVVLIRSMMASESILRFPFLKQFATGLCSLSIFGIGYFSENTLIMAFASVIPLVYGLLSQDGSKDSPDAEIVVPDATPEMDASYTTPQAAPTQVKQGGIPTTYSNIPSDAQPLNLSGCFRQGDWFIHSFTSTYQDTNSVGNVYFGMYGMWVGKTRELFFLHTMPDFDLKSTDFYILTRSYEHKFIREATEFEQVSVYIKIKDYNRKFVTLEHKVLDSENKLLGKGNQTLMFVNSKDYGLIDIPQLAYSAFMPFIPKEKLIEGKND